MPSPIGYTPSFVITLSWHISVKKVPLSTPRSLISAQQTTNLRFAQPQAAAMASSMISPPAISDRFNLRIYTPANLNRGAHIALLQNSPAIVNSPVSVLPGSRQMAQILSLLLNAATTATAIKGAKHTNLISIFK
jgi:hypothetical protein